MIYDNRLVIVSEILQTMNHAFVILLIVEITFLIADIWHEHVNKFLLQEKKCQIIEGDTFFFQ